MAISQRTESANRLVYVDEAGVAHEILLALLGGQSVWDGRVSQSIPATTGLMSFVGLPAEVSSGSTVTATDVGYMTLTGLAAVISSGSTVSASTTPALTLTGLAADVQTIHFTPVGMLKSGSSSTVGAGSLKLVTGMVADPAFPGSTVSSNGVTILQSKSDATITMSVNCTNPFNTTITVAAYKNGVQIGTSLTRTGDPASFVVTGSVTGAVTAGDVITLMASAATGTTTINVADTFLNVT